MTEALRTRCERAMHVVTPQGRILRAGRASLWILEELGFRRIARVGRVPPIVWAVELGYRIVARNRQFFGSLSAKREDR